MLERRDGLAADRDDALFVALANDVDEAGFKAQLLQAQAAQFRQAQARAVGKLKHGLIAKGGGSLGALGLEEGLDLRDAQRLGEPFPAPREREIFRDILGQIFLGLGEGKEGPQRGNLQIEALRAEFSLALVLQESHKARQRDGLPCVDTISAPPRHEVAQQGGVGFLRLFRAALFVAQADQEILNQLSHQKPTWVAWRLSQTSARRYSGQDFSTSARSGGNG